MARLIDELEIIARQAEFSERFMGEFYSAILVNSLHIFFNDMYREGLTGFYNRIFYCSGVYMHFIEDLNNNDTYQYITDEVLDHIFDTAELWEQKDLAGNRYYWVISRYIDSYRKDDKVYYWSPRLLQHYNVDCELFYV